MVSPNALTGSLTRSMELLGPIEFTHHVLYIIYEPYAEP